MIKHAELLFYEERAECDMCDKKQELAILNSLGNDVIAVCKNCLEKIIEGFDK